MIAGDEERREIEGLLAPRPGEEVRIAVVGASADPDKYGNIIVRNLKGKDLYTLWPVNPREERIEGLPVYRSLADLPGRPEIVNVVTPPRVSLQVLEEAERLGCERIWFQEGSFDDKVLERLEELSIRGVHGACIMVAAARAAPGR